MSRTSSKLLAKTLRSTTPARLARRGRIIAALIPLGALAAAIGLLILVSKVHNEDTARQEMLANVDLIANESAAVTDGYLGAAESGAEVLTRLHQPQGDDTPSSDLLADTEPVLASLWAVMSVHPQLDGAFVGFPDGGFVFLRRDGEDFSAKIITIEPENERTVELRSIDADFTTRSVQPNVEDSYDPRDRPWYQEAVELEAPVWTDPYTFFETGEPGVTHARPVVDTNNEVTAVIGLDVRLTALITFLGDRRPSSTSTVSVVNGRGELIAGTENESSLEVDLELISATGEAGVTKLATTADGPAAVSIKPVVDTAPWHLVVSAPEADFLSGLRENADRLALTSFLAIVAASAVLWAVAVRMLSRVGELHRAATCDSLTGLANRETVREDLNHRINKPDGAVVAVLIIDIDRFKTINDTYGHLAGDLVLTESAKRLTDNPSTRTGCRDHQVGRLGGDELIVVFEAPSVGNAYLSTLEVHSRLQQPFSLGDQLDDQRLNVGFSIGLSWQPLGEKRSAADLLREADIALYRSKAHGGGVSSFSNDGLAPVPDGFALDDSGTDVEEIQEWLASNRSEPAA